MKRYVIAALCSLAIASCFFGGHLYLLIFGWIHFLWRVVPQMTFDALAIAYAGLAILILTGGVHATARWLRSVTPDAPRWRLGSSTRLVAAFVLLFVAGTAIVGIVHQATWLVTREPTASRKPMPSSGTALRMQSWNNLQQIVLAIHNHAEQHKTFPPGGTFDERGEGLHGWGTSILPYLDVSVQGVSYDKPWHESPNRELFKGPIDIYENKGLRAGSLTEEGIPVSHYAGNVHVLPLDKPLTFADIHSTSQTLLVGEVNANFRAWPSPYNVRDPNLGINSSPDGFGGPVGQEGAQFAMLDGAVRMISDRVDPRVLRQLADPRSREKPADSEY